MHIVLADKIQLKDCSPDYSVPLVSGGCCGVFGVSRFIGEGGRDCGGLLVVPQLRGISNMRNDFEASRGNNEFLCLPSPDRLLIVADS